ncbi:hypothetical protein Tco_1052476, partial [Tanacetum coccineum]
MDNRDVFHNTTEARLKANTSSVSGFYAAAWGLPFDYMENLFLDRVCKMLPDNLTKRETVPLCIVCRTEKHDERSPPFNHPITH